MAETWYVILGVMLTGYVVLDGFDLGVGVIHLITPRDEGDRRHALKSIGPVWDGNEVWLVTSGAIFLCAFPSAYATALSGFYLPLIMLLWLLIFRGLAVELRSHISNPLWRQLWDVLFCGSSIALAFFLGVALGNVVRGIDLDTNGRFFAPLWTDLRTSGATGILDWYTILVGALAVGTVALHGAAWLALRSSSELRRRSFDLGRRLTPAIGALFVTVSAATSWVAPRVADRVREAPWGAVLFILPMAALTAHAWAVRRDAARTAFAASAALIITLMAATLFGTYPYVLPASAAATGAGITIEAAAANPQALSTALSWWVPGMVLVLAYHVVLYRSLDKIQGHHDG